MQGDKIFGTAMFGFDKNDVNAYMEKLIKDSESKIREKDEEINLLKLQNRDIRSKFEEVARKNEDIAEDKNKIISVLVKAQEKSDAILEQAKQQEEEMRQQAKQIIDEAQSQANQILEAAKTEANEYLSKLTGQGQESLERAKQESLEMISASKAEATELLENARRDSDLLLSNAKTNAEDLLRNAREEADNLTLTGTKLLQEKQSQALELTERQNEILAQELKTHRENFADEMLQAQNKINFLRNEIARFKDASIATISRLQSELEVQLNFSENATKDILIPPLQAVAPAFENSKENSNEITIRSLPVEEYKYPSDSQEPEAAQNYSFDAIPETAMLPDKDETRTPVDFSMTNEFERQQFLNSDLPAQDPVESSSVASVTKHSADFASLFQTPQQILPTPDEKLLEKERELLAGSYEMPVQAESDSIISSSNKNEQNPLETVISKKDPNDDDDDNDSEKGAFEGIG